MADHRFSSGVGPIAPEDLPGQLRSAIEDLQRRFPKLGLTLFVFDFEGPGIGYISNARRADMRRAIQEWLDKEVRTS